MSKHGGCLCNRHSNLVKQRVLVLFSRVTLLQQPSRSLQVLCCCCDSLPATGSASLASFSLDSNWDSTLNLLSVRAAALPLGVLTLSLSLLYLSHLLPPRPPPSHSHLASVCLITLSLVFPDQLCSDSLSCWINTLWDLPTLIFSSLTWSIYWLLSPVNADYW